MLLTFSWEQRRFLTCIKKIIDFRGRTPKKLGMEWSDRGYLALSAFNVKNGYVDFSQDVHYGDEQLYERWMGGNELHKGQVIFTTEAPMGNVAQVPDDNKYILSQRTIAFDVHKEVIEENFLAILLQTPKVNLDLKSLASGGTAIGISQKSLKSLSVVIPSDLKEQKCLVKLFRNINAHITVQQRKLVSKDEVMNLFLCKSNTLVDVDVYANSWEQRRLGEVAKFYKGRGYSKSDLVDEGTPIILYGQLYTDYKIEIDSAHTYAIKIERCVISQGREVLIPASGETAEEIVRASSVVTPGIILGGDLHIIEPTSNIHPTFLALQITYGSLYKSLVGKAQGKSVVHLQSEDLQSLNIKTPTIEEQRKIVGIVKSVDHHITFQQRM